MLLTIFSLYDFGFFKPRTKPKIISHYEIIPLQEPIEDEYHEELIEDDESDLTPLESFLERY